MQSGCALFVWLFFYSWLPVPGLGVNLLVESTENYESVHPVNVTRFLFYRSGVLESSRSCLSVAVKNVLCFDQWSLFLVFVMLGCLVLKCALGKI